MDRRRALLASISSGGVIPNNEIWYVSARGTAFDPVNPNAFGANIVSNTYENGKGVITFDGDVTMIGENAYTCSAILKEITLPRSAISFTQGALSGCSELIKFSGQFATKDGRCMVAGTTLLYYAAGSGTEFTIPTTVTRIMSQAFYMASMLTSVTIPSSVEEIGAQAFMYCGGLETIICERTTPPQGASSMFSMISSTAKIYVPAGSGSAYKKASYWSTYKSKIVEI